MPQTADVSLLPFRSFLHQLQLLHTLAASFLATSLEAFGVAVSRVACSVCYASCRGAHAAAVVYDITSPESFEKAKYWISELQKNASGSIGGHRKPACSG